MLSFNADYAETHRHHFELSHALASAITNKEIGIAYQPIINVKTGCIDAFEALARWNHAGKAVSPQEFIALAEETDRIVALGYLILEKACTAAATWLKAGHNQKIAVNISVKQLLPEDFVTCLTAILNQTKLPARQLSLEVTESLFDDENIDLIFDKVEQLKNMGINTQIDDFGTGYSSLSRLHQFPIGTIKIDRSFVAQIQNQGHAIIESTILIAQNFNFEVVAEGVETLEQAQELYKMGVDYFQGYYFSKPLPKPVFDDFETKWHENVAVETSCQVR
jgi:diguanylate cyclase